MAKKEVTYFHGDAIHAEYPEHLDWFLPGLAKNLNKVLANENLSCQFVNIDYNNGTFELKVDQFTQEYHMNSFQGPDDLINSVIGFINNKIPDDHLIETSRPFNNSNLTISFTSDQKTIKAIEDFSLPNKSDVFPGDFYLPIFDNSSKSEIVDLFKSIADLNTENSIKFNINDIHNTEYVDIDFEDKNNSRTVRFDVRDFDRIGIELNKFLGLSNFKYVLVEPNEDSVQYSFCQTELIYELAKYQLVRKEYL